MSSWKGIKWLTYTLLSSVLIKLAINIVKGPSDSSGGGLDFSLIIERLEQNPFLISSVVVLSIVCSLLWLFADRKEALEQLVAVADLFVPSDALDPKMHLSINPFHSYYQSSAEVATAQQAFSTSGRLLILGRPAGGKTRLAYNLAKQMRRHWVLRLRPGFSDWKSLSFPRIPWRCKVVWIIDDLDKFLGKFDFAHAELVLKRRCRLKIIVTCRKGQEFEMVRADKELAAFVEPLLPGVACPDLGEAELLLLAEKTGKPLDSSLYDGTPGSVTLGLAAMRQRLQAASPEDQALMKAMFLLRTALIYNPAEQLVTAVFSEIYGLDPAEEKVEAAVLALKRDGFLRQDQPLTPGHDCYLTPEFFRYYPSGGKTLKQDLFVLGDVVEKYGTLSDCASIGTFWSASEDYSRALPYLQRAAAQTPDDGILGFHLGLALYRTGNLVDAVAAFKRVVASNPYHLEALCNLALFQSAAGTPPEEALPTFDSLLRVYNLYRVSGEPAPALRRSVAGALAIKGMLLHQVGRDEDAIQTYDDVIRRFGAFQPPLDQPIADAFFNKGVALAKLKRMEEAVQAWDEVLSRFKNAMETDLRRRVVMAAVNKGVTLVGLGRNDQAVEVFDDAVHRFGGDPDVKLREQVAKALVKKGDALSALNRLDEEIQAYNEVLRRFGSATELALQEHVARALVDRGITLQTLNRHQEARASFQEALGRFKNSPEGPLKLAFDVAELYLRVPPD
jgi:tetratricopeptide (TPR) repeat protein